MSLLSSSSTADSGGVPAAGPTQIDYLGFERHEVAWIVGGLFAVIATIISFVTMYLHWKHNAISRLRHTMIWVLGMVPVYSICAWWGLKQKQRTELWDLLRECFEAIVIYAFFRFLLGFMGGRKNLIHVLRHRHGHHMLPFCWLKPWTMGRQFLDNTLYGTMQYVPVKLFLAALTFILSIADEDGKYYLSGDFSAKNSYIYITLITNASQVWAMYSLVLFYKSLKDDLAMIRPIPKFLCIKLVVFFTFWQSVLVAALVHFNVIGATETYSKENVSTGLQDFIICIEMMLASMAHLYAFPHKEFAKGSPACNKAESNLEDGIRKHVSFAKGEGIIAPSHSLQQQHDEDAEDDAEDSSRITLAPGDSSSFDHDPDSSIAHDPRAVALHSVAVSSADDLSEPLARGGSGSNGAAHHHISTSMQWDGTMSTREDED